MIKNTSRQAGSIIDYISSLLNNIHVFLPIKFITSTKVFPILNIDKLEGEESSIELLSLLPKASDKFPREKDKEKNKSKKRKHKKRNQEQQDILEAQRRSKVDEELRLDELRACASGASSSSVPIEAGLISGFHVMMESQTLTTTQPFGKGTPEVSLTVPSTTSTNIEISGDTQAHASYPGSNA
ncbi:hypothetical protein H5410_030189 [Solanum commersonii]|uniref:Uncharacterized protein n=1 Tax=Solanum commersonii TaxID=4109 RepID=A0A9J5YDK5_SOLCO|nr:hypothetical protein H5410_030189 [Solanum commersonii]